MPVRIASRIEGVTTSIFTEMSALAAQHGAINLSQGFPDFSGPRFIKDAAKEAIERDQNQYSPSSGLWGFQDAVGAFYARAYGRTLDPRREVTVTSGATEGLFVSILAFVNPGDEVIVVEPYYDAYPPIVRMAGGVPVFVRAKEPRFRLPVDEIAAAITPRTRAIMLNSPLNPAARVFSREELTALAQVVSRHDVVVISDEVYERLVFPGHEHVPFASLPGMWERTVALSSTGKTFSMTGWKVGYIVANPALGDAVRRVHQFNTFCTATPLQAAMAAGLLAGPEYERDFLAFYTARRQQMVGMLEQAGFVVAPCEGTYFVMADYRALSDKPDVEFCRWLTTEIGVAAIPPSAFYSDGYQSGMVRFCFSKKEETLNAAAERLARIHR